MTPRILIVEGDPASRDDLVAMLAARAYRADAADDGVSALRLARENLYDLVFVDYHLPGMDGYAFARAMRAMSSLTGHRVYMAAMAGQQDCLAARRPGDAFFDQILFKPVHPAALYDCVNVSASLGRAYAGPDGKPYSALEAPAISGEHAASHALWRVRGLAGLPNATVLPQPSAAQLQRLSFCFSPGTQETADCIVLLSEAGLPALANLRETGSRYLLPVFGLSATVQAACDHVFDPADAGSWTEVARMIKNVHLRTVLLKTGVRMSHDAALRILAYLFVSERPVRLHQDESGATTVSRTAGFDPGCVIASLKFLAGQGLITSRTSANALGDGKDLEVLPNERGLAQILDGRMTASHSNAG